MRRFAALLAVVFLAACTNEIDQSTRPTSVAGSYQLRSYSGRSLPALVSTDSTGVLEITGGSLVIGADQSWSETQEYRLTKNGVARLASVGSSGSWLFLRDFAFMLFNDKVFNYQFSGTAAGGSVTLELDNGTSMVFAR
jgi:ABC-type phosphate transport system substrate-binding protein